MGIVNDDSRVVNKLETSLTDDARVVIYDHHMFIVQATGGIFWKGKNQYSWPPSSFHLFRFAAFNTDFLTFYFARRSTVHNLLLQLRFPVLTWPFGLPLMILSNGLLQNLIFYTFSVLSYICSNKDNQLPNSAARWQDGSQICFATFIFQKITKLLTTQQLLKLEKK